MKLIDFHTHAFPPAIAGRTLATLSAVSKITPHGDGTREGVLRELRAAEADLAVVLNVVTKPGQETTVNNTAKTFDCLSGAEGNTVYFGSVHPQSPHASHEVHRIRALGLKGIKIHPDYQHTEIWDEAYFPIFEAAEKLGLVVGTHAGWDPLSPEHVHATPEMCEAVLKTFPRLKLVLAHFGGMYRYDEAERVLAGRFENLYFDTAFSLGLISPEQAKRLIEKQTSSRILFGSDFPWHSTREERDFIKSLSLREEDEENIFYKNAQTLLGLTV
ncbi:MAG: amidohydrolase [Clostridia bacterium]|nr:amidohydrolase [Clostridia bacterium]